MAATGYGNDFMTGGSLVTASSNANKLHREVLRWIQSLDLAYSIKNVKRDFANGFLVAEILSRYYDKDISMHSYDNGIGLKVKRDNWEQLLKVFHKIPDLAPLAVKIEAEAILHCEHGAAVAFITKLYQCLTKRTIQSTTTTASSNQYHPTSLPSPSLKRHGNDIPPYAKATGATLIREKMRAADIVESTDEREIQQKVHSLHAQHEEHLFMERMSIDTSSERSFGGHKSPKTTSVMRGESKPIRSTEVLNMAPTVVKQVQVKAVEAKTLEKLRQNRDTKDQEATTGLYYDRQTRDRDDGVPKRRAFDLINDVVSRKLNAIGYPSRLEGRGKGAFENFLDAANSQQFSDDEIMQVLKELKCHTHLLATTMIEYPTDFWKFSGVLFPFISENEETHPLFQVVQQVLADLGQACTQIDETSSILLMNDYLLPRMVPMLKIATTKRPLLLQIMYAYLPDTIVAHLQAIKRLREAMGSEIPTFIHTLSILITLEHQFDSTLMDLYHYYCCIGLETPCEKLRAAALSMLVPMLSYDHSLIVDLLPRMKQFATRSTWWEVNAQLLIVASTYLDTVAAQSNLHGQDKLTESIENALTIIEKCFSPTSHVNLRKIGLSHLAKNLKYYQELVPLYVDVLLSLEPPARDMMINAPQARDLKTDICPKSTCTELPVRGTSGARYGLKLLPLEWDSTLIAKQLYYQYKDQNYLQPTVLEILQYCFEQLATTGENVQFQSLFEQMQGFIIQGLLALEGCRSSVKILELGNSSVGCVDFQLLQPILIQLINESVQDHRQHLIGDFLQSEASRNPHKAKEIQCILESVRRRCDARVFSRSRFASL